MTKETNEAPYKSTVVHYKHGKDIRIAYLLLDMGDRLQVKGLFTKKIYFINRSLVTKILT